MKKILSLSIIISTFLVTGCSTMFTTNRQNIEIRTKNDIVGERLDNVTQFEVITDANRVKYSNVKAGNKLNIHRKSAPIVVKVVESTCILPSEERFDSGVHPAVILDILATSMLSTSIDSSTGALWRYDETLTVTPKIKDTPECREWLNNEIAKMQEHKPNEANPELVEERNYAGYMFDPNSELHPKGYTDSN